MKYKYVKKSSPTTNILENSDNTNKVIQDETPKTQLEDYYIDVNTNGDIVGKKEYVSQNKVKQTTTIKEDNTKTPETTKIEDSGISDVIENKSSSKEKKSFGLFKKKEKVNKAKTIEEIENIEGIETPENISFNTEETSINEDILLEFQEEPKDKKQKNKKSIFGFLTKKKNKKEEDFDINDQVFFDEFEQSNTDKTPENISFDMEETLVKETKMEEPIISDFIEDGSSVKEKKSFSLFKKKDKEELIELDTIEKIDDTKTSEDISFDMEEALVEEANIETAEEVKLEELDIPDFTEEKSSVKEKKSFSLFKKKDKEELIELDTIEKIDDTKTSENISFNAEETLVEETNVEIAEEVKLEELDIPDFTEEKFSNKKEKNPFNLFKKKKKKEEIFDINDQVFFDEFEQSNTDKTPENISFDTEEILVEEANVETTEEIKIEEPMISDFVEDESSLKEKKSFSLFKENDKEELVELNTTENIENTDNIKKEETFDTNEQVLFNEFEQSNTDKTPENISFDMEETLVEEANIETTEEIKIEELDLPDFTEEKSSSKEKKSFGLFKKKEKVNKAKTIEEIENIEGIETPENISFNTEETSINEDILLEFQEEPKDKKQKNKKSIFGFLTKKKNKKEEDFNINDQVFFDEFEQNTESTGENNLSLNEKTPIEDTETPKMSFSGFSFNKNNVSLPTSSLPNEEIETDNINDEQNSILDDETSQNKDFEIPNNHITLDKSITLEKEDINEENISTNDLENQFSSFNQQETINIDDIEDLDNISENIVKPQKEKKSLFSSFGFINKKENTSNKNNADLSYDMFNELSDDTEEDTEEQEISFEIPEVKSDIPKQEKKKLFGFIPLSQNKTSKSSNIDIIKTEDINEQIEKPMETSIFDEFSGLSDNSQADYFADAIDDSPININDNPSEINNINLKPNNTDVVLPEKNKGKWIFIIIAVILIVSLITSITTALFMYMFTSKNVQQSQPSQTIDQATVDKAVEEALNKLKDFNVVNNTTSIIEDDKPLELPPQLGVDMENTTSNSIDKKHFNFSNINFSYPADWIEYPEFVMKQTPENISNITMVGNGSDNYKTISNMRITTETLLQSISAKEYVEKTEDIMKENFSNIKIKKSEELTVAGREAPTRIYTYEQNGNIYYQYQVYIADKTTIYIISFTSSERNFEENYKIYNDILSTLML